MTLYGDCSTYTGLHICCLRMGWACMRMRIMLSVRAFFSTCMYVHGLRMYMCVSECVDVCRCFDMHSKSPPPECNVSLVGSHARVTVNNGSTVTQPTLSSGLARGVVITPLNAGHAIQSQN